MLSTYPLVLKLFLNKMRVITISTFDYSLHAIRMVRSLRRVHPDCEITVYTEKVDLAPIFEKIGATLCVLPEIERLGVKRAKFAAYADAAKRGGFIYLDSDILVLHPLIDLKDVKKFTACRDDLSGCSFIDDKKRPWKKYPQWTSDRYFNSGVFAAPAGFGEFFNNLREEVENDSDWADCIIPGKLFDNHYLCAKIVKYDLDVDFVSEYEYNWQGYVKSGVLNCHVDPDGNIRSNPEGRLLRLVHFAGIRDIDSHIGSLPIEVARILASSISSIGEQNSGVLELMNAALNNAFGVEERLKLLVVKALSSTPVVSPNSPGEDRLMLSDASSVASIALSTVESNFLWNGLKCGGAYLSAAEYKELRDFIVRQKIGGILEFGAGYTTTLFNRLVNKQVALEGWNGPWLDFARSSGCDARKVVFSPGQGFDEGDVKNAVDDILSLNEKSMIFIDSPPGTESRRSVVEQVIRSIPEADYYVVHDSIRDSSNVYRLAAALGLHTVHHFESRRGLTFLAKAQAEFSSSCLGLNNVNDCKRARFSVAVVERERGISGNSRILIELKNSGDILFSCGGSGGLQFSVHLIGSAGEVVAWDTPRYTLPVNLEAGDAISFWLSIPSDYGPIHAIDCDFVKEGEFWWSDSAGVPCPRIFLA